MEYKYFAFGLKVASTIPLNNFPESEYDPGAPQVKIIFKPPIRKNRRQSRGKGYFHITPEQCFLSIKDMAIFHIRNGSSIIVRPFEDAKLEDIFLILMGSAFGALLHQRGYVPLHASAVKTAEGAVLFCGKSGAGKSTMAASFIQSGFSLLADDICAIRIGPTQKAMVLPGFPRLNLCTDTNFFLNSDGYADCNPSTKFNKYYVSLKNNFSVTAVPVYRIYHLCDAPENEWRIDAVKSKVERFDIVVKNIYQHRFTGSLGLKRHLFDKCDKIVGNGEFFNTYGIKRNLSISDARSVILDHLKKG